MISFMVVAAPRSATAWVSNWLTTDKSLCYHDPLFDCRYEELDALVNDRIIGMACTGAALFPEFINAHPARKVILHRDKKEIDASLKALNLPTDYHADLHRIRGEHCQWRDVFDRPKIIYEFLLNQKFDAERHRLLCKLNVQRDLRFIHDDSHWRLENAPHVFD
jgi:hypothetical protein